MEENEETQKLFRAVKFGKSKEVKQLLENDASLLNSVDSKANTLLALHWAYPLPRYELRLLRLLKARHLDARLGNLALIFCKSC